MVWVHIGEAGGGVLGLQRDSLNGGLQTLQIKRGLDALNRPEDVVYLIL